MKKNIEVSENLSMLSGNDGRIEEGLE